MARTPSHSPLLYDYLKRYQEDPTSRIFAPLAEAYRKSGLVDEAIEIAREGLRVHPTFIGGRVALARSLFDKREYDEVVAELSQVIRDAPDNLVAQRLLGESCLMLGRVAEALGAYKMLLYYSPSDLETAKIVRELESQAYEKGTLVLLTDPKRAVSEPKKAENVETPPADLEMSFTIGSAQQALKNAPETRQADWVRRVELLQGLLQKVERYRTRTALP